MRRGGGCTPINCHRLHVPNQAPCDLVIPGTPFPWLSPGCCLAPRPAFPRSSYRLGELPDIQAVRISGLTRPLAQVNAVSL